MFNADISGVRRYTHFEQNGANGNVESPFVPDDSINALVQEKREPKVAPSEYHYVPGLSKVSNNLKWAQSIKKCDPEVRGPMSMSKSARNMMVGKDHPEVRKA